MTIDNNTIKDIILKIVNRNNGIKAVELAMKVMEEINPSRFFHEQYMKEIEKLLQAQEIIELEVELPHLPHTIKSYYFPKGTMFNFNPSLKK
jgi:hypothetical protein